MIDQNFFSISQGKWAEVSQDPLDWFSQSLHHMVDIQLQMINPIFFSNNVRKLPWQPIKVEKNAGVCYGPIYFVALPLRMVLQYCNFDLKRLDRMNISTACTILVKFGPETSEFTLLTIAPFVVIRQKSAYHVKYLRTSWTYLDLLYRFGRRISGDDFPSIRLAVAQGTLLWQPVKHERRSQTSGGTVFTLCFGIRQRIRGS